MNDTDLATLDRMLEEQGTSGVASALADLCDARHEQDPYARWDLAAERFRSLS